MSAESRDASLHGAARDKSISVSIVADGSHHGANYFGVSDHLQHHTNIEQDDKSRSPSSTAEHRDIQSEHTPEQHPVSTVLYSPAITLATTATADSCLHLLTHKCRTSMVQSSMVDKSCLYSMQQDGSSMPVLKLIWEHLCWHLRGTSSGSGYAPVSQPYQLHSQPA